MATARVGGVVYLRVDDKLYPLGDGDITFNIGGLKREAVLANAGVAGFSAKPQVPYIEGELVHTKDLDIPALLVVEDARVTAELYNGKTVLLHNAYFAGDGEFTSEGKLKFRFEGLRGELING